MAGDSGALDVQREERCGSEPGPASRVWFTLGYGILNEIYYPDVDTACTRDVGLIVTDGRGFLSEEKRHARHEISCPQAGVPAFRLVNTCAQGRYRIEKEIIADPSRHAVLQRTRFTPLLGRLGDYHLHVLAAPHLGNRGAGNTAWVGEVKGVPMLLARRHGYAMALACSAPWLVRSAGFVGTSDGWQDLVTHNRMEWSHPRAENGNVALCGEVDLRGCGGAFVLSLGFGATPAEAGHHALASLQGGFDEAHAVVCPAVARVAGVAPRSRAAWGGRAATSTASARQSSARTRPGISPAAPSPACPSPGASPRGTRTSVATTSSGPGISWRRQAGFSPRGPEPDARRVLAYLRATQEADGHWPQNMWLDGTPYWSGVQMDETAFPILLVDLARREQALGADDVARFWPMVRRAAGYLARNGPVTQQDRWEEDPGYSPFTLAVEIAGLLAAADLADLNDERQIATYLRETADCWNASIERWTYVSGTEFARQAGVEGHYVRVAPADTEDADASTHARVSVKNRARIRYGAAFAHGEPRCPGPGPLRAACRR